MKTKPTFEQIINATSNGLIATDQRGRIFFINKRAEKILGLDAGKTRGEVILDVLPITATLVFRCLETGQQQLRRQIVDRDVSLVEDITPIVDVDGIRGAVCNFIELGDVETSLERLESYKSLNEQWNKIFRFSSDGIIICDGKGNILNINEASLRIAGRHAQDDIGKNVSDLVKDGIIDRSVTLEVLKTKRQISIMQYLKKRKKHLLLTGTPVFDENGEISLVVVNERDITQLNALKEELERSRRVTEKFREELTEQSMLELREGEFISEDKKMREVQRVALKLANLNVSNILLLGESGTGKGLLAKFIHKNSRRSSNPFVQINCAALPESLLEAELFGYEKGAFTGARDTGKVGLLELSEYGTLFLDEIGELPLSIQSKILKYLDDHEIMPLGGTRSRKVECTVIAATNRDLETLKKKKTFREDLFYRLHTFPVKIPPLRERPEDIFPLVNYYLSKYNKAYGLKRKISQRSVTFLQSYPFPGNVRELKNIVKKAVVMSDQKILDDFILNSLKHSDWSPRYSRPDMDAGLSFTDEMLATEKAILKQAIKRCVSTRQISAYLGISQSSVVRKLKKHALATHLMHK